MHEGSIVADPAASTSYPVSPASILHSLFPALCQYHARPGTQVRCTSKVAWHDMT